MSKLTDQQLDDLFFGHLRDLEKDPPNGSWSLLAKNVSKNNFLKFGWKHFNIFYLAAATVILSSATYFIVANASKNTQPLNPEKSGLVTDSVSYELKNTNEQESQEKRSPSILKQEVPYNRPQEKSNLSIPEHYPVHQPNDSLIRPGVPEIDNTIDLIEPDRKEETPKPKKIITITKRDTIRITDTVKKERIRW